MLAHGLTLSDKFWHCCSFFIKLTTCRATNMLRRTLANKPISALFFNLQQMFLLRVKLITQGEKPETSTKTCKETLSRDKLRVFVSRISPPLNNFIPSCRLISMYLPIGCLLTKNGFCWLPTRKR